MRELCGQRGRQSNSAPFIHQAIHRRRRGSYGIALRSGGIPNRDRVSGFEPYAVRLQGRSRLDTEPKSRRILCNSAHHSFVVRKKDGLRSSSWKLADPIELGLFPSPFTTTLLRAQQPKVVSVLLMQVGSRGVSSSVIWLRKTAHAVLLVAQLENQLQRKLQLSR